jgi:DNA-binding SARP family transcriptional activator/Flp pilus assembly protein TadD/TolB-like protein
VESIRLRVLGRAVVERDGVPVRGRCVQSHHLALLALLAASPGRTASRERLIGWLWPESDSGRARHRLSVALHAVRRGLGTGAVLTTADSVVLNPEVVWTDVGEFLDAIESGRLEDAVRVCAGPFLDGFYLKHGADFERWAEGERNHLADLCRSALERLAEEAEGKSDLVGLAEWRRRLTVLAPYDSSLAVALMQALAAKGDAAGAIAHARAYATRVEAHLGIPVNPAVPKLAAELTQSVQDRQARSPVPAGPPDRPFASAPELPTTAPRRPRRWLRPVAAASVMAAGGVWLSIGRGVAEREDVLSVVVIPFTDLGGGDAMGEALAAEIGATLAIVPNLSLRKVGSASRAATGEIRWRRIARDVRAARAVTGVVRVDGLWAEATFQLRNVATGETLWESREERRLRSTDALVEALSMAIADELRTRLARYVPHHYTDSESANDAFLKAVFEHRKMDEQHLWVALQHYRRAWEEDPKFALAHAIAGNAYMGLALRSGISPEIAWERGREHVMRAMEIDPTLPEAYSILGRLQLNWDRDFEAAEATLRRAIMLYPTHPDARTHYGFYQLYYLNDFDGAVANMRRSLEFDPLNTGRSRDVETVLYQSRRFEELAAQHRHTWSLDQDVAASLESDRVANAYREMGLYDEAIAEYQRVREATGGSVSPGLGVTYARMGRQRDARDVLRQLEEEAGPDGPSGAGVAALYATLGDTERAFQILARLVDTNPSGQFHLQTNAAFDLLRSDPRFDELLQRIGLPLD